MHYLGHRKRLLDKFNKAGIDAFHDYEIVELLLTYAIPRRDCKVMAKELLKKFGSLQRVIDAPKSDLMEVGGVGERCAALIKLVRAIAERYRAYELKGREYLTSTDQILKFLELNLRDKTYEIFLTIMIDSNLRIIGQEEIARGTIDQSAVYPRNVFAAALKANAMGLVLAHNHPDGPVKPSEDDVLLTRDLYFAGKLLGIEVYDHIIIGKGGHYSFRKDGLMEKMEAEYQKLVR